MNVYNATDQRGLASRVAAELKRRGFHVGKVDNDPLKRQVTGAAEVRSSTAGAGAARTVSAQVGTVVAVPDQRTERLGRPGARGGVRAAAAGAGRRGGTVTEPAAGAVRLLTC